VGGRLEGGKKKDRERRASRTAGRGEEGSIGSKSRGDRKEAAEGKGEHLSLKM